MATKKKAAKPAPKKAAPKKPAAKPVAKKAAPAKPAKDIDASDMERAEG